MANPPDSPEKKSEKKKSRLRRVGRRLLFRKGSSHHPSSSHRSNDDPLRPSSYGALQETERWQNRARRGDNDDEDDEMSLASMPSLQLEQDMPTWMFWNSNRRDLQTISSVESVLRWIILLTGSFMLGVNFSSLGSIVGKSLEYAAVAWITCIMLGILLAQSSSRARPDRSRRLSTSFDEEEGRPLLTTEADSIERGGDVSDDGIMLKRATTEHPNPDESTQSTGQDDSGHQSWDSALKDMNVHAALNPYFIIDCHKIERALPNSTAMYPLDTDYFSGHMMVLIRTPDVDDSALTSPPANATAVEHLRGKQRRFEFQFQVRLKKIPTGTVYFSCDLTQKVSLGMVQRAFVSAAMSFVRSSNPTFHYSIQGSTPNEEGTYERPHMAFPVQDGMNRVVATPPGMEPPRLGTVIEEDSDSLKRRKKGSKLEWNLEDTYTFSLWSAYVDFLDWRVLNLPGIRPFGLNSVIGNQPIYLTLYEIDDDKEKHHRKDMTMIAEFEMSNSRVMGRSGPVAQKWQQKQRRKFNAQRALALETGGAEPQVPSSPKGQNSREVDTSNAGQLSRKRMLSKKSASMEYSAEVRESSRPSLHSVDLDLSDASVAGDDDDDAAQEETPTNQLERDSTSAAEEAEADAAAELGEGIYVKSGDCILLREASDDSPLPSFLSMGGGFAVLQEQTSSTITIEKAGRSRRGKLGRSKLIKSGDTVLFKLVTKGRKGTDETRYLSIHRGWWLKWVPNVPTNNGYFTIYTRATEFDGTLPVTKPSEIQSSYLSLGEAFWLRHRRWSKFSVGAAGEGSTTYGGRMLGLYTQRKGSKSNLPEEAFISDDPTDTNQDQPIGKQTAWLKPLQLRAFEPPALSSPLPQIPVSPRNSEEKTIRPRSLEGKNIRFSEEDYRLDAPVWIEMMDRTHRIPQLAYVVRVQHQNAAMAEEKSEEDSFVRIRTGRDLAQIMRAGLNWRTREVAVRRRKVSADLEGPKSPKGRSSQHTFASPEPSKFFAEAANSSVNRLIDFEVNETQNGFETQEYVDDLLEHESDAEVTIEEIPPETTSQECAAATEEIAGDRSRSISPVKKRKFMGKLAHTVKSKTASTGKAVVRGSVKVGKGTMSAGKAILPIRSMNPPAKEPNQKNPGRSKRQTERDLHVAVSRSMRRIERMDSRSINVDGPAVLAGELAAPEQSARTVSNMLAKMSSIPRTSEFSTSFNELLSSAIESQSPQDEWFLQGGAVQLGVPHVEEGEGHLFDAVVGRCLWESHWREEWCVIRGDCIRFYAPNAKAAGLELLFDDIRCIRELDSNGLSPLPGFPILVIETAWMCHYAAFATEDKRDTFRQVANRAKEYVDRKTTESKPSRINELRKARYWQGFKSSVESSLGKGKWAEITSNGKPKSRTVLNNRRMVFDLPPKDANYNHFVEEMLVNALSLSEDTLVENPETLVKLLDATSYLQILRLDELDFSSAPSFCLFVNIYHCLLQHALLLTVNGPLKKLSCAHFMRTTCYEVGGDVFSLAELQHCVIRGSMSKALHPKPPYIEVPKKSGAFRYYALSFATARLNFVLNTGDLACPKGIIVLQPEELEEQLNLAASEFIKQNVKIDESKRTILVPKVCDVYRGDFGFENASACLQYCLGFMDYTTSSKIQDLLREQPAMSVKFHPISDLYHSQLRLKTFESENLFSV